MWDAFGITNTNVGWHLSTAEVQGFRWRNGGPATDKERRCITTDSVRSGRASAGARQGELSTSSQGTPRWPIFFHVSFRCRWFESKKSWCKCFEERPICIIEASRTICSYSWRIFLGRMDHTFSTWAYSCYGLWWYELMVLGDLSTCSAVSK